MVSSGPSAPPARRGARTEEPLEATEPAGPPSPSEKIALGVILAVAALLLLYGLGAPRLWQDEAETALLGRNVLRFGLPRVWDGNNLVAQYYALDFDSHLLYQKSWLPSYLAAGSFALLGQGTFAARLPFALCGLVTVWLTWRVGRKLTGDGPTAVLAALLLALSLPFLLYSRQCRWYAPAMAVTLLLVEAEERLAGRWGWLRFGAAIGLLFHLNYLVCGATVPALVAARLWTRGWRSIDRRLVAGLSAAALLTLPFFAFFPPFAFADEVASTFSDYPSRMAWVLGDLNRYLLPLPGIAVLSALAGGRLGRSGWTRRLAVTILLAVVLSNLTLWPRLVKIIGFRYVINVLPLAALLLAAAICSVRKARPWWIAGLVGVHLSTHLLGFPLSLWPPSGRPGLVRTDLYDYAESLLRPVRGPIDGAVEFLQKNAKPGDLLFTPYEQLPLQFYTDIRTGGLQRIEDTLDDLGISLPRYVSDIRPEEVSWYLPRRDWERFLGAPSTETLLRVLASRGRAEERFVLDAPDLTYQTREYPPEHHFRTPPNVPPVVIYKISDRG